MAVGKRDQQEAGCPQNGLRHPATIANRHRQRNADADPAPVRGRRKSALLACVEKRRDQREYFAGPAHHADVRGPGEHGELGVRQEFEHLHHVRQW
jgi:hypothetical protein